MTVKVKFKGDKIKVQAGEGYCPNVKDLLILKDNGNGYFVKLKHTYLITSWRCLGMSNCFGRETNANNPRLA